MNVRDNLETGKYINTVPYDIEPFSPPDTETTTIAAAARLKDEWKARRDAQRLKRREEQGKIDAVFEADLAEEHGLTDHPKRRKLFELAYEAGHSCGMSEVEIHYSTLAELLKP